MIYNYFGAIKFFINYYYNISISSGFVNYFLAFIRVIRLKFDSLWIKIKGKHLIILGDILKKIIFWLFIGSLVFILMGREKDILIPNNAIRFRVIANSNSVEDQQKKMVIKDKIEEEVYDLIKDSDDVLSVRNIINENLDKIQDIIEKYDVKYNVSYGYNYFPIKNYKGVKYEAGNYESLVITIGEGLGDNFWCVLFPPLCLIENDSKDVGEVQYKFLIKKLLNSSKY